MDPIVLPSDLAALYAVLASPIALGILISLLVQSIPQIQDKAFADWKKVLIVVVFCTGFSLFITAIGPNGLPATPAAWYNLFRQDVSVLFANQIFYELWMGLPFLGGFVLRLFGKAVG